MTKDLLRCIIGPMNSEVTPLSSALGEFIKYLESKRSAHATILAYSKDIEQLVAFLTDLGKKNIA